jgi:flagellar protein FliO/FliZ
MFLLKTGVNIDSIAQLFTMIAVFILVLVLAYVTSRFAGGIQKNRMSGSNMRIVETIQISGNKYLQIVCVAGKYLLLAVCKDSITCLCELDEKQINIREVPAAGEEFKKIFTRLKDSNKVEKDEDEEES